ncbi:MAG: helix-turn-helix transcriptional regulator [Clostridia bacterium]|nr:helix-turn-helix transcriptional regulator [Clostridia bacterium]
MLTLTGLRHAYPENGGFRIDRPNGLAEYTFLHFWNSMDVYIQGEWVRTAPHACIFYDIYTPQLFRSAEPLTHDWMHFTGEAAGLLAGNGLVTDHLFYPADAGFITVLMKELETEFYGDKWGREPLLQLKLAELFIKLGRAVVGEQTPSVDHRTEERFRALRGEVFGDLARSWTVAQMAAAVNLSESRFYTLYKSLYGTSPVDDLIRARVDAAKNRLTGSNAKLAVIAEGLGYNNVTHFSRQFKALTGVSPAMWRRSGRD